MGFAFLWEMSWKSALIAGVALGLAALLRRRGPADRAAVLRLGVTLLLMLPMIALFLPALQIETAAEPVAALPIETWTGAQAPAAEITPVPATIWDDPSSLIGILYVGGVLMVLLRVWAGLATLRRWTREATPVADAAWLAASCRVQGDGPVRLLVSEEAEAPLSWGWLRPAILIDRDTLERAEDADAVLAHEIAHVARRDWPMLMMTRLAVALFWFNPLAWLLERELVQQAEEAADLAALARVEPARYAQTLVSCARHGRAPIVPANSMAPRASGLRRRVAAILEGRAGVKTGSFWTLAAMLGCAGFAAPLAAVELVPAVAELIAAPSAPQAPALRAAPSVTVSPAAPRAVLAAVQPPLPPVPVVPPTPPAPPSDEEFEVPAVDVDVPAHRVHVPAVRVDAEGVRVDVPAIDVVVPRVRVNVPPIKVRMPRLASVAVPAVEGWSAEDRAEFQREMAEVRREAHRGAAEARAEARAHADAGSLARIAEVRRNAAREARRTRREIRVDLSGAADGMEQGAREMEETAEKLRDRGFRETQIARARARGETTTHQELLDAIPKLRTGAENMRESAQRMRRRD